MGFESHSLKIVLILTVGFAFASLFGYFTQRARLSPILGYLLAGYFIGPYSPGYVADIEIAEQLAEIGVVLMMFGVGLHFKLEELLKVKSIAIPGAILQTLAAAICGAFFLYAMNWSLGAGLIIGLSIGVASTVVLVRMLSEHQLLKTEQGHIAVGWLIVEDILTVVFLITVPILAVSLKEDKFLFLEFGKALFVTIAKVSLLGIFMFTIGQKVVTYLLFKIARTRSQELFIISILAMIFLTATGSALIFGTSLALGAFIAGMVIGRTHVRHQATSQALPIQDVFFVIFFLSVGMLFNPAAILTHPFIFLGILGIILVVKPFVACLITWAYRYPLKVAFTVAFALAQIGEFSFILSEEAMKYDILPEAGYDLLVACAIVSIAINPLLFRVLDPLFSYLGISKSVMFVISPLSKTPSPTRAIIVGYGPIGRAAMQTLERLGFIVIVVDLNVDTITQLIAEQRQAVYGDASQGIILESAQIKTSSLLVITIPDAAAVRKIIAMARQLNPEIELLVRARFLHDRSYLAEAGIELICCEKESMQAFEHALNKLAKARFQNG